MPISFAGVNLTLKDPRGDIQRWIDQWLPTDDLRMVCQWSPSTWNRTENIPLPNYPAPLRPKINTLYRPTGASRWAFGLFLATREQKQQILNAIGSANSWQPLTISSGDAQSRAWMMYMLPPRPISALADGENGAWLLPLVDERYYWQFVSAGQISLTDDSTWTQLFDQLRAALGINTLDVNTIPAAYGSPNVTRFNAASFKSAAAMLDAAAHSVGQRIFLKYEPTGTPGQYYTRWYQSGDFDTSQYRLERNLALSEYSVQAGRLNTGLNLPAITPASVRVVFRKWANGIIWDNEFYSGALTASGATSEYLKTIRSTALADYTSEGPYPDNQTAVDQLGEQIAKDFYKSIRWIQDSNIVGVSQWAESGYDDYLEFSMDQVEPDGSHTVRTRIHSAPFNFGVEEMLHQVPNTHEYGDFLEGTLDTPLSPHGYAMMNVFEGLPPYDSLRDVLVIDRDGYYGSIGATLAVHKVNKIWRIITMSCPTSSSSPGA